MHTSLVFGDLLKLPMVKGVVLAPVVHYYSDEDAYRPDVMFTDQYGTYRRAVGPHLPTMPEAWDVACAKILQMVEANAIIARDERGGAEVLEDTNGPAHRRE
jgi:hypothetical protein